MKKLQALSVICCSVIVFGFLAALLVPPEQTSKVLPAHPTVRLYPDHSSDMIVTFTNKGTRDRITLEEYFKNKYIK